MFTVECYNNSTVVVRQNIFQNIIKTIYSIVYYFTWLTNAHVVGCLLIIQVHFDYLESKFMNGIKSRYGAYVVKKET